MKTIKKLLFAIALLISINSFSQDIITADGDTVANINSSGIVTNSLNQALGQISATGEVKNAEGVIIGNIVGQKFNNAAGTLIAESKMVGSVTQIIAVGGLVFATLESGNKIIENEEVVLRSSGSLSETHFIAYFFYFNNK